MLLNVFNSCLNYLNGFEFDIKHAIKDDCPLLWKYIIWERSSSVFCKTISHVLPQQRQSHQTKHKGNIF